MSEPLNRNRYAGPPRVWDSLSVLCFLCYTQGNMLADCPRLPTSLQREAKENREACSSPTPVRVLALDLPRGLSPPDPFRGHPARPIAIKGRQQRVRPSAILKLRSGIHYLPKRSYCPRRRKKSREATRDGGYSPSRTR
jgi:hypothetical protein